MCTEKEDLLTVYFWVWREGLRQLHLLHCTQLNGWNLWKQIFWTSGHPCCKESWQNGMKSRHSQETVIKCALEGRKVAPANTCRYVYMDATTLLIVSIYTVCVVFQSLSHVQLFVTLWIAARQAYLSQTPRVCSNSCSLSPWGHATISSSVIPFSSCLQSFTASGCFPMSQFFASGGQSIGASTSASVLPMNPSIERLYQWVSSVVSLTYNNKTLQHILVFHGCRTNYHTFCGLKQDRVIIS